MIVLTFIVSGQYNGCQNASYYPPTPPDQSPTATCNNSNEWIGCWSTDSSLAIHHNNLPTPPVINHDFYQQSMTCYTSQTDDIKPRMLLHGLTGLYFFIL